MPTLPANAVKLHYEQSGDGPETTVFSHSHLILCRAVAVRFCPPRRTGQLAQ